MKLVQQFFGISSSVSIKKTLIYISRVYFQNILIINWFSRSSIFHAFLLVRYFISFIPIHWEIFCNLLVGIFYLSIEWYWLFCNTRNPKRQLFHWHICKERSTILLRNIIKTFYYAIRTLLLLLPIQNGIDIWNIPRLILADTLETKFAQHYLKKFAVLIIMRVRFSS